MSALEVRCRCLPLVYTTPPFIAGRAVKNSGVHEFRNFRIAGTHFWTRLVSPDSAALLQVSTPALTEIQQALRTAELSRLRDRTETQPGNILRRRLARTMRWSVSGARLVLRSSRSPMPPGGQASSIIGARHRQALAADHKSERRILCVRDLEGMASAGARGSPRPALDRCPETCLRRSAQRQGPLRSSDQGACKSGRITSTNTRLPAESCSPPRTRLLTTMEDDRHRAITQR